MGLDLGNSPQLPPTIILGEDKVLSVQLKDSCGTPIDLTSATAIDCMFQNSDLTCVHYTLALSTVVVTNAPFGEFNILLSGATTALLNPSAVGALSGFEVHYTIGGKTTFVLLSNSVSIIPRLFPTC